MLETFAKKLMGFTCSYFAGTLGELAKLTEELSSTRSTLKYTATERDDAKFRVDKLVQGVDTSCKEV